MRAIIKKILRTIYGRFTLEQIQNHLDNILSESDKCDLERFKAYFGNKALEE